MKKMKPLKITKTALRWPLSRAPKRALSRALCRAINQAINRAPITWTTLIDGSQRYCFLRKGAPMKMIGQHSLRLSEILAVWPQSAAKRCKTLNAASRVRKSLTIMLYVRKPPDFIKELKLKPTVINKQQQKWPPAPTAPTAPLSTFRWCARTTGQRPCFGISARFPGERCSWELTDRARTLWTYAGFSACGQRLLHDCVLR